MSDVFVSLLFGVGAAGWFYAQLTRRNGNAVPANNMFAAAAGGVVVMIVFLSVLKFGLHM